MFSNNGLTFIDSSKVKVYPCGRRRSLINEGEVSDKYYLPFDAEARLNTEANNRKHSGLNGYKQSYIYSFEEGILTIVIGGYLFEIQVDTTLGNFANALGIDANTIYANIKLETVTLFSGTSDKLVPAATTNVLRDQSFSSTGAPLTCLDLPYADGESSNNYYFSGLSFTSARKIPEAVSGAQEVISLAVLTRRIVDDKVLWELPEKSKLPQIDHGSVENSIKVGVIEADSINVSGTVSADKIRIGPDGNPAVALNVVETSTDVYQLNFVRN